MSSYECRAKTYFRFDKLCNLIVGKSPDAMICIISDNLYIHTNILTLKTDLKFLMNFEVQVFEERPLTFYL